MHFFRSYKIFNFGSKQLVQRNAEELAGCVVRPDVLAGVSSYQDGIQGVLEQGAKLLLAPMQPLLGQLALGDVFVGEHRSRRTTGRESRHPSNVPPPFAG